MYAVRVLPLPSLEVLLYRSVSPPPQNLVLPHDVYTVAAFAVGQDEGSSKGSPHRALEGLEEQKTHKKQRCYSLRFPRLAS